MRSAGKRQLLHTISENVSSAAFDQRQRLDELDRRARKDRVIDVTDRHAARSARIDRGDRAAVAALHPRPTGNFDKNGIDHAAFR